MPARLPLLLLGALACAAAALRLLAYLADRRVNRLSGDAPAPQAAPAGLPYADLHADPLLWNRDLLARHGRGHTDVPRLRAGGVGLQIFSVVAQAPLGLNIHRNRTRAWDMVTLLQIAQGRPPRTWLSRRARA